MVAKLSLGDESELINRSTPELSLLMKSPNDLSFAALIKTCSDECIKSLLEIFYNIGHLNVEMRSRDYNYFRMHSIEIEEMIASKNSIPKLRKLLMNMRKMVQRAIKLLLKR